MKSTQRKAELADWWSALLCSCKLTFTHHTTTFTHKHTHPNLCSTKLTVCTTFWCVWCSLWAFFVDVEQRAEWGWSKESGDIPFISFCGFIACWEISHVLQECIFFLFSYYLVLSKRIVTVKNTKDKNPWIYSQWMKNTSEFAGGKKRNMTDRERKTMGDTEISRQY